MDVDKVELLKTQLQQWLHQGEELVNQIPPTQIYAAIGVVTFTIFFLLSIRLFKRTISNTIVLTGLNGSGKAVLFYQLRDGSSHQGTVTSMEPNEGLFVLHSETTKKGKIRPVHLVDVPGHSRLRPKLDEFLPRAAGIVFVVDAVEFLPNCRGASKYLYDILTKPSNCQEKNSTSHPLQQSGQGHCTYEGVHQKTTRKGNQQAPEFKKSCISGRYF